MKPLVKLIKPGTALLAVAGFFVSSTAVAQVPCGERDAIVKWLGAKYKEAPVASGVGNKGNLVEVLSTRGGETWTVLVTLAGWPQLYDFQRSRMAVPAPRD